MSKNFKKVKKKLKAPKNPRRQSCAYLILWGLARRKTLLIQNSYWLDIYITHVQNFFSWKSWPSSGVEIRLPFLICYLQSLIETDLSHCFYPVFSGYVSFEKSIGVHFNSNILLKWNVLIKLFIEYIYIFSTRNEWHHLEQKTTRKND